MADNLQTVFAELHGRMLRAGKSMVVARDQPGDLILKTPWNEPGKKEPAWFGAVQIRKNYVSCHLMPLYARPELMHQVTVDLQRRMQGKSCFNFKVIDPELFEGLERLMVICAAAYEAPVSTTPH